MIARAQYELIKATHGGYASWAIWAAPGERPKSNIGDLSVLTDISDENLALLKADVVMVGLNISRALTEPFRNFHDPVPKRTISNFDSPSETRPSTAHT